MLPRRLTDAEASLAASEFPSALRRARKLKFLSHIDRLASDHAYDAAVSALVRAARRYNPEAGPFSKYARFCMDVELKSAARRIRRRHIKISFQDHTSMNSIAIVEGGFRHVDAADFLDWSESVLSGDCLAVFRLLRSGMSVSEIARATGLGRKNVSRLKAEAFKTIKEKGA
jgi:RNA polymerase sigma factor (sigma-70 family)